MEEKCSVGKILDLNCKIGKYRSINKTELDDLSFNDVELLKLRSKIYRS